MWKYLLGEEVIKNPFSYLGRVKCLAKWVLCLMRQEVHLHIVSLTASSLWWIDIQLKIKSIQQTHM